MLPSIRQTAFSGTQNISPNSSLSPATLSQDYEYESKADYMLLQPPNSPL